MQTAPAAATLRLVQLRMEVRLDALLDKGNGKWFTVGARRLVRWLAYPILRTIPECANRTRREVERLGGSRRLESLTLFFDSLVDSYKYGNGLVTRHWFDRERRQHAAFHIPNHYHRLCSCYLLNHRLNPGMPREQSHHDKFELYELCRTHGWPAVPLYASFVSGQVTEYDSIQGAPLLSKPAALKEGQGHFERWCPEPIGEDATHRYRAEDGSVVTVPNILDHVAGRSLKTPYLLQELLSNHEDIRALSGGNTLCTLRLPTCCFPSGEVESLPLAFLRMPRQKNLVFDNMARGGIAYRVNSYTGCLEAGAIYGSYETFSIHPTTSKKVVGFRLPYWQEAVDLCKTAHAAGFSNYPTVGWDVALTDRGPMLVEMNIQWATEHGIPNEGFLGETAYVDCVLSYMHRLWPDNVPEDPAPHMGSGSFEE